MSALFYTERISRPIRVAQVVGITTTTLFCGNPHVLPPCCEPTNSLSHPFPHALPSPTPPCVLVR